MRVVASSPEISSDQLPVVPQLRNVARPLPLRVTAMLKVLVCTISFSALTMFHVCCFSPFMI